MNLYSELNDKKEIRQERIIERIQNNCDYLMCSSDIFNIDEVDILINNQYLKHKFKLNNKQQQEVKECLLNALEYTRDNNIDEEDEELVELINEYIQIVTNN